MVDISFMVFTLSVMERVMANAKQALSALEAEARKQGIPAGWLR